MRKKVKREICSLLLSSMLLFLMPSGILLTGAKEVVEDASGMESAVTEDMTGTESTVTEGAAWTESTVTEGAAGTEKEQGEVELLPEDGGILGASYKNAQTWYPKSSGYFMLTVRDNARGKMARYRIDCSIGERHSNGINYRIYYNMYLIAGDELGITLENKTYYTRHDNATSEIGAREYHLPVTFHLPEMGYHFEGISTGDCYQTYFESMEEQTCSFVVDTNGCGMTPWAVDGAWHNDNIEVNYLENRYTITYDGNGATSGSVLPQEDVIYGKWVSLQKNQYKKEYTTTFAGNGGVPDTGQLKVKSTFIGWEDHNNFYDKGIDFPWYAFDAPCYAKANPDVLQSIGYNKAELLNHFYKNVVHGRERRISSPCFRLTDYMKYGGSDLKNVLGSRPEAYLLHWINSGYSENRRGIGTIVIPADLENQAVYEDGAQVANLSSRHQGEILLKAKWKDEKITFPDAKRTGYRLIGWADSRTAVRPDYQPGETAVIGENKTFYALWEKSAPPVIERMVSVQNGTEGFDTFVYVKDNGDGIQKTAFAVYTEYQGQDDLEADWKNVALGEEGDYQIDGQKYNYRYTTLAAKHNYEYGRHLISIYASDKLGGFTTADTEFTYQFPLIFDGNGGLINGGNLKQESRYYGAVYGTMPEAVKENCTLTGWSSSPDREELITEEDVFLHAGEQTLYAWWDESPVIEADDQYFSLYDAREGRITEELLLQQACAKDKENVSEDNPQGQFLLGIDETKNTIFCVEDYKKEEWENFAHEGNNTITYYAKDSIGNISRKQITVYLVDTSPTELEVRKDTIRFISPEYLNTIPEDSVWQKKENYMQLEQALDKSRILEIWNLNHQKMEEIKEYEAQEHTGKMTEIEQFRSKFFQCIGENDQN